MSHQHQWQWHEEGTLKGPTEVSCFEFSAVAAAQFLRKDMHVSSYERGVPRGSGVAAQFLRQDPHVSQIEGLTSREGRFTQQLLAPVSGCLGPQPTAGLVNNNMEVEFRPRDHLTNPEPAVFT